MTNSKALEINIAMEIVAIDFLKVCIANGATKEQAQQEMTKSLPTLTKRVLAIMEG